MRIGKKLGLVSLVGLTACGSSSIIDVPSGPRGNLSKQDVLELGQLLGSKGAPLPIDNSRQFRQSLSTFFRGSEEPGSMSEALNVTVQADSTKGGCLRFSNFTDEDHDQIPADASLTFDSAACLKNLNTSLDGQLDIKDQDDHSPFSGFSLVTPAGKQIVAESSRGHAEIFSDINIVLENAKAYTGKLFAKVILSRVPLQEGRDRNGIWASYLNFQATPVELGSRPSKGSTLNFLRGLVEFPFKGQDIIVAVDGTDIVTDGTCPKKGPRSGHLELRDSANVITIDWKDCVQSLHYNGEAL